MTKVNFINNARIIVFMDDDPIQFDPVKLPELLLKTIDYCVTSIEMVLKAYIHIDKEFNYVQVNVVTWDGCGVFRKSVQLDGNTGAMIGDYNITDSL